MENMIRLKSVNLIAKLLHPLTENGVLSLPEEREIEESGEKWRANS